MRALVQSSQLSSPRIGAESLHSPTSEWREGGGWLASHVEERGRCEGPLRSSVAAGSTPDVLGRRWRCGGTR